MVFGVAALDYAVGPLPVPKPRKLAVDTFPAQLGPWQGGAIAPVDADIQARLPTSAIMDREYTTADGQAADVMLVTASDNLDIHNPKDCFPSQGWILTNSHDKMVQGQVVTVMDAQLNEQKMTVLYWTTGIYTPPPPRTAWMRKALELREKIVPRHEYVSLFVRLMVPQRPNSSEEITRLAEQVMPPVQALLRAKRKPGEQVSALPLSTSPLPALQGVFPLKRSVQTAMASLPSQKGI